MEKNGLRYTSMIADGNYSMYKTMSDVKPYGSVNMKKYECVGHVQKRMGAMLIDMKKKRYVVQQVK